MWLCTKQTRDIEGGRGNKKQSGAFCKTHDTDTNTSTSSLGSWVLVWKPPGNFLGVVLHDQVISMAKRTHFFAAGTLLPIPIGSMYAIYGNIYHQYTPHVSIYTIHGSYGIAKSITNTTARLFPRSAKNAQSACVSHRNQMILNGNR